MKNLKKLAFIALGIIVLSCSKKEEVKQPSAAFEKANTTVTAIPNATSSPGTVEVPITIDNEGIIGDGSKIYIELDLTHDYVNDLAIELISPSGDSMGIIKRIAGCDNFLTGNKLVFNSTYSLAIPVTNISTTNVPGGNYKPTFSSVSPLIPINIIEKPMATFFNGKSVKGIWILKIYDCNQGDTGSVNSWKIKFDTGALQ